MREREFDCGGQRYESEGQAQDILIQNDAILGRYRSLHRQQVRLGGAPARIVGLPVQKLLLEET